MPFTPFHLGLGMAAKAAAGKRFSLAVFGLSQIAIDIEPLVHLIRNDDITHGFWHTYLGGLIVACLVTPIARPLGALMIRTANAIVTAFHLPWLTEPAHLTWRVTFFSALFGTFTHVFLDSIVHMDATPLAPWSHSKWALQLIPTDDVYRLCVVLGVIGAPVWLMKKIIARRRDEPSA